MSFVVISRNRRHTAGMKIDGNGAVPSTGSKGFIGPLPFSGTIIRWTLTADLAGDAQITLKKCGYGAYPIAASIVAAAPVVLSSADKAEDTDLTGWTKAVEAGDFVEVVLDSVSTCTVLLLAVEIEEA